MQYLFIYLFIYLCFGVSVSAVDRVLNSTWVDLQKVCNRKIQWPTTPVWWQKKKYCSSSSLQYIYSFRVLNTFVLAHARNNINIYKLQNAKVQMNIYKCSDKNKLSFNLGCYTGSESITCRCFHGGIRQQVPLYNSSWEERIFEIVVSGAE